MDAPGWLSRHAAEVPPGDAWLGEAERAVLRELRRERRREDWRLGRFTAKAAIAAWLGVTPERVTILRAGDGAPEAWLDGRPAPVSLSLSHRAGTGLAVVGDPSVPVGCDLELIEPRSGAFVREWLGADEQRLVASAPQAARAVFANVIWSAKEAASKVLREGLRLNVRDAAVSLAPANDDGWDAVRVDWRAGPSAAGWWRIEEPFVIVVLAARAISVPRHLPQLVRTP